MQYLEDPKGRFQPYFSVYAEEHIIPAQLAAKAAGQKQRARTKGLDIVEERLIVGERSGSDKSSSRRPDEPEWDTVDHLAFSTVRTQRRR